MTRAIVTSRIDSPEALKDLKVDGYTFREDMTQGNRWVFARKQPPPVGK